MSYQIQEINRRIQADPKEFVDACDAAYAEKIERAARAIAENVRTCPIVLLSGPSGSGKTTTAMKIAEALRGMGISSQSLAMDDYFRTVNPRTAPRTPEGDIDFESPACLDMDLLGKHLNALARGEDAHMPAQAGPAGRGGDHGAGVDEYVEQPLVHRLLPDGVGRGDDDAAHVRMHRAARENGGGLAHVGETPVGAAADDGLIDAHVIAVSSRFRVTRQVRQRDRRGNL